MKANELPLKRSFAQVANPTHIHFHLPECSSCHSNRFPSTFSGVTEYSSSTKRRLSSTVKLIMPMQSSASAAILSSQPFPSFMEIVGTATNAVCLQQTDARQQGGDLSVNGVSDNEDRLLRFQHRESISSATSESTESSPTTDSTFDNTSVIDASPSSSPESPTELSLLYTKSMTPPAHLVSTQTSLHHVASQNSLLPSLPESRPVSPGRRARNLKNLSLRVPIQTTRPAISTAAIMETGSRHLSAPPSPVHRPMKSARRRPANLTILTPAPDRSFASLADSFTVDGVPPTPSVTRTLRHIESSPSLASIFSPTIGPSQGMQFPRPRSRDDALKMPGAWQESPVNCAQEGLGRVEEEDDYHLHSRESTKQHERGYPDGPIKIYDQGVYLYLEPSAEEASKFDVVINVAKEVSNPFDNIGSSIENTVVSTLRKPSLASKRRSVIEPQTAASETSFHSAFEFFPADSDNSPTTPKAEKAHQPEYIHVPWDHNSEILEDLQTLCEIIHDRISKQKSVLIHCQLGASRSASLVIAYGLYTNRDLDFNSMYAIVKAKSRWVGPNMSLIYQLTDFRSKLGQPGPSKSPPSEWFRSPKITPPPGDLTKLQDPAHSLESYGPVQASRQITPMDNTLVPPSKDENSRLGFYHEGQHSQPSSLLAALRSPTAVENNPLASPRPLPFRERYQLDNVWLPLPANPEESVSDPPSRVHARYPSVHMDLVMQDIPASPSVLSPRAAGFMASSVSRTLAGDLAGDKPRNRPDPTPVWFDPRSPPQRGEPIIMRNIDEFLW